MIKKNILIATHSLGIGGCETYVVTMARELKEKGNDVTVIANDGIFRKHLENMGVNVEIINFFDREQCFENIDKIEKIIKEKNITDVCVNPFYPFFEVISACIKTDVSYDLFFHGVSLEGYFDVKYSFDSLGIWSGIYIKNIVNKYARNYVYVSEEAKTFYEREFGLEKEKGIVLRNSVKIEKQDTNVNKIEKIVMISRIDSDKLDSIKCAIELYKSIFDNSFQKERMCLDIVGTGNKVSELQQIVQENKKYNINLKKETDKSSEVMKQYDAVIGMGRTIIEAMSLKRFPILVTYNNYIGIVDANNHEKINKIAYANFSGRNMQSCDIEQGAKDIIYLKSEDINRIINSNYEYVSENNDIETNLLQYMNNIKEIPIFEENAKEELEEYLKVIKYIISLEKSNKAKSQEIDRYENMLNNIYNKKIYKGYRAVKNIFKRKS